MLLSFKTSNFSKLHSRKTIKSQSCPGCNLVLNVLQQRLLSNNKTQSCISRRRLNSWNGAARSCSELLRSWAAHCPGSPPLSSYLLQAWVDSGGVTDLWTVVAPCGLLHRSVHWLPRAALYIDDNCSPYAGTRLSGGVYIMWPLRRKLHILFGYNPVVMLYTFRTDSSHLI